MQGGWAFFRLTHTHSRINWKSCSFCATLNNGKPDKLEQAYVSPSLMDHVSQEPARNSEKNYSRAFKGEVFCFHSGIQSVSCKAKQIPGVRCKEKHTVQGLASGSQPELGLKWELWAGQSHLRSFLLPQTGAPGGGGSAGQECAGIPARCNGNQISISQGKGLGKNCNIPPP